MTSSPSSVSALPSSFCDSDSQPLAWWWRFPGADNPRFTMWQSCLSLLSHELNLMAALKPFIRTSNFIFLSSVRFSDFQWWSFENIKRQSKLILSSQIIISSLGLSSNFLTLVFTRHFSTEIWEQFTNHFPESPVKTSARWLEFPASLYKLVFPLPITLFLTPEFPRPSHALSSHVVKIPPKCGVTSGSHSSGVYYLK